jgi:cell division protein FtsL
MFNKIKDFKKEKKLGKRELILYITFTLIILTLIAFVI